MDEGGGSDHGRRDGPETANTAGPEPGSGSDRGGTTGSTRAQPDLRQVARDWVELWESELSAMAVDREAREACHALMPLWTGASLAGAAWAGAMSAAMKAAVRQPTGNRSRGNPASSRPPSDDAADRCTRAEPATGTAPPAPAPDPRDDEIQRLTRDVAELEARLAALERDRSGAAGGGRKRKR